MVSLALAVRVSTPSNMTQTWQIVKDRIPFRKVSIAVLGVQVTNISTSL